MHSFAAVHQSSTAKLSIFFQKFKKRACRPSDNETKPDTENDFGASIESKCDEMDLFGVSLQSSHL